jgi:hypothetical protein
MKRISLLAALTFIILIPAIAQNRTLIGIEGNLTSDYYKISDPGNEMKKVPIAGGLAGILVRQEIGKKIFLETGVMMKNYDEGIGFKKDFGYSTSTGFSAWVIPLRAGMVIPTGWKRLRLVPVIGYALGINRDFYYGAGGGAGTTTTNTHTVSYEYYNEYTNEVFHLLQAGLGLQFRFFKRGNLTVSGNFYPGLTTVMEQDISYSIDNGPIQFATAEGRGRFWSIGLGIQYPISQLWKK